MRPPDLQVHSSDVLRGDDGLRYPCAGPPLPAILFSGAAGWRARKLRLGRSHISSQSSVCRPLASKSERMSVPSWLVSSPDSLTFLPSEAPDEAQIRAVHRTIAVDLSC